MKPYSILLTLPLIMAACSGKEQKPLLTGTIEAPDSTMISVWYDIDGDTYSEDLYTDSLGNFTFNTEIPSGTDLTLSINGRSYGARIENGATTSISIDGEGNAEFSGDNVAESRWLNECVYGYDSRRFKHLPERDGDYDPAVYMAIIDKTKAVTESLLPEVKNDSLRAYYERLGSQFYNITKANILSSDYYYNVYDKTSKENPPMPEEIAILRDIDPNDDASRHTGALFSWANTIHPSKESSSITEITLDIIQQLDTLLTNPANHRSLVNSLSTMAFMYPLSLDELKEFVEALRPRLSARQQKVIADKIAEIEARVKDGDKIPVNPELMLPDGSRRSLTDACEGKVAYIDMWATWCGPCCAQIPYMEKVAEHYKGSDKIVCISISCDDNLDAWHKKLDQDKPEWAQYVFQGEDGQQFMKALGVTGIPRFIVLTPDMTIARLDAPRPQSTDEVIAMLDSIASGK